MADSLSPQTAWYALSIGAKINDLS